MATVIPGAEAYSSEGGDVGCLLLHGFTGNPASLRPLAETLTDAGLAVELPRLPGHGTTWRQLQRTGWRDWVREAQAGLTVLRDRTRAQVVVGLSMGGALALHLAQTLDHPGTDAPGGGTDADDRRPAGLVGAVVINPWLRPTDPRAGLVPWLKWVLPATSGVGNDIAKPGGDELAYDRVPLRAVASVFELQRSVRTHLDAVRLPLLVLTSRQDHVIDPADSRLVMQRVGSDDVEQVMLADSYHVATLDYDADLIAEHTLRFVRRVAGVPESA